MTNPLTPNTSDETSPARKPYGTPELQVLSGRDADAKSFGAVESTPTFIPTSFGPTAS